MNKSKRTVTVDNSSYQDEEKPSRRPSVFDRLGPGAMPTSKERHVERQEQCRNWLRNGECTYGSHCKYLHKPLKNSKSSRERHESPEFKRKGKLKREDYSHSPSPVTIKSRREKSSSSTHKSKLDYETKLRSTIVKPKSPGDNERFEKHSSRDLEKSYRKSKKEIVKKPLEQQWEEDEQEDSDDWDAARLDYKEELTLEMKRQQLKRELELELQKEEFERNNGSDIENVIISKQIRSSSSSSSSSSHSSSASSSSISSSSSSSSSESGSDSDSSGSSSDSGQKIEKFSKARHKKSQSKIAQRSGKYKSSQYAAVQNSPSKSESKRNSKGPRTPSPTKSNRNRNEYVVLLLNSNISHQITFMPFRMEHAEFIRKEKKLKGKQKINETERKRYSVSPPTSPGSSDMDNIRKDRHGWKNDGKEPAKKFIQSASPSRAYSGSGPKRDKYDKPHSAVSSSASHKRNEHSTHQSPNSRGLSRTEMDSYKRGRSPRAHSNHKDSRQRSLSPKEAYSAEKLKYSSEKVRLSVSPSNEERPKSYRDHRSSREPRERTGTVNRDEARPRDSNSPSRARNVETKGSRYPDYYEDESQRRARSPQSPTRRSRRDYHPERDASLPSRDRLPPLPESDIIARERHNEKIHGSVYSTESSRNRQIYDGEGYAARHGRNYHESDYPPRGEIRGRDYLPDPIRERELPFRNIDGHRDSFPDIPRERDYGRPEYHDREYYQDPAAFAASGQRDSVGRAYSGRGPDERRRDPLFDIPGRERHPDHYMDVRVDERDRFPHPLPNDDLDRNSRRRARPGQYIPEGELRGKHDWPPRHADYPDLPPDRYGYHPLDYALEPASHPHGWDERSLETERNREPYYSGRRQSRHEPDERGNKRRSENSAFPSSSWEVSEFHSKKDYPPSERDYLVQREHPRDREPPSDSGRDRRKDVDREKDRRSDPVTWPERRGRKRERSNSPDQLSEQQAEKRPKDSHQDRKHDSTENRGEKRDRVREPLRSESRTRSDRKPTDNDSKTDDALEDRRSSYKKSNQRANSRDRLKSSPDRREEKSQLEPSSTISKRGHSLEGSIKDDSSEKSSKNASSEKKSRRSNHDLKERSHEDRDVRRSSEDRDRYRKSGTKDRSSRGNSIEKVREREIAALPKPKSNDDKEKVISAEIDATLSERKKHKREYKPDAEDANLEETSKKPRLDEETVVSKDSGSDVESNENLTLSNNEKLSSNSEKIDSLKSVDEDKKSAEFLNKEEIDIAVDTVSPEGGVFPDSESFKSASPVPEKTVVVDEVLPSGLTEERIVDSCKGSEMEDNKDNEEDLSEWSDGDDELLTRDEVVKQHGSAKENFLTNRVVKYWNKIPNHVKCVDSVEKFKNQLGKYKVEYYNSQAGNYWELSDEIFNRINKSSRSNYVQFMIDNPEAARQMHVSFFKNEEVTKEPEPEIDVSKPLDTSQKTKRIEEIKADHSIRTSRSSSLDRPYHDRSNRSLSSERSRGSREGSRERYRGRDRRRNEISRHDKEGNSRSGSRNTSLDRSRDFSNRSYTGGYASGSTKENNESSSE
ncbi:Zinc finger CCCH domain-containing protein 13 [Nymphon striatum]|nr:Zinc finger CCCH domain-containing protein 13 [Nymphon striatum]